MRILTVACVPPPQRRQRTKVTVRDIKQAIHHAQNLCLHYEDTPECRIAWEVVEELSTAFAHAKDKRDPDECKMYDS
jgi:hypothetical protein